MNDKTYNHYLRTVKLCKVRRSELNRTHVNTLREVAKEKTGRDYFSAKKNVLVNMILMKEFSGSVVAASLDRGKSEDVKIVKEKDLVP